MAERPFDVREDLRDVAPYRAPQVEARVRLNTNESPWPPPDGFVADLAARIPGLDLRRYPDREATAARAALGARHDHDPGGVWIANGSNELIQQLLLAFGGPGRRVVLFEPTYAMHRHIARLTGTEVVAREVEEPWVLEPDAVAWGVSFEPPALTFICSPNNPTGNAHGLDVVRAALESGPGLVVVDEAYGEFGGEGAEALLPTHDRLVVLRSFSKSWRLAGARIGYLLAHPWLVEALQVARLPYHVSALTQACAEAATKHQRQLLETVEEIVAERDRLTKELQRVPGVEVFPSDANFVLVRTTLDGATLWQGLVEEGVLVRDVSAQIPRAVRVTVGTGDENAAFVAALRKVLADGRG